MGTCVSPQHCHVAQTFNMRSVAPGPKYTRSKISVNWWAVTGWILFIGVPQSLAFQLDQIMSVSCHCFNRSLQVTGDESSNCVDSAPIEVVAYVDEKIGLCLGRPFLQGICHMHLPLGPSDNRVLGGNWHFKFATKGGNMSWLVFEAKFEARKLKMWWPTWTIQITPLLQPLVSFSLKPFYNTCHQILRLHTTARLFSTAKAQWPDLKTRFAAKYGFSQPSTFPKVIYCVVSWMRLVRRCRTNSFHQKYPKVAKIGQVCCLSLKKGLCCEHIAMWSTWQCPHRRYKDSHLCSVVDLRWIVAILWACLKPSNALQQQNLVISSQGTAPPKQAIMVSVSQAPRHRAMVWGPPVWPPLYLSQIQI